MLSHIIQDVLACVRNNACDIQPESNDMINTNTKLSSLHAVKEDTSSTSMAMVTLSHANKTLSTPKREALSTTDLTLSPTTVSATSTAKVRFDDSSQLQDNMRSNDMPVSSFPTEQANRQKERKKAGIVSKKRKQHVEQHKDEVGDNLSSIDVEYKELAHYQNLQR